MPKFWTFITIFLLSIGLIACSDDQAADESQPETDVEEESHIDTETESDVETKVETVTIDEEKEDEVKEESEKNNSEADHNDEIADFDEASVIEDTIDIANMDVKVKTDNPNNRVLLFSDDHDVMYKTVYIKKKQRLKIINIHEDKGQIFNEVI